jgi:D-sedoheptulose 7-phosphate isomerase
MNNIDKSLRRSQSLKGFAKNYTKYLYKILCTLDENLLNGFAEFLNRARVQGKTIFFIGNGGSAATASHMANDFGTDILKRTNTKKPFKAMSLTDNCAVMLAVANDSGYENLFVNQLKIHYRKGDVLVAISASGNSPNVVEAAKWVKNQKGKVLSLTGFDGGKLKNISDIAIIVKSIKGEYGPVEDVHMILDHLLSYWLQHQIQKDTFNHD